MHSPDTLTREYRPPFQKKRFLIHIAILLPVYCLLIFIAFHLTENTSVGMFGLFFVLVVAWRCGKIGGLLGGVIFPVATGITLALTGHPAGRSLPMEGIGGFVGQTLVGFFVGLVSDIVKELKNEITQRKLLEKKLKQYQDNLEALVEKRTKELEQANEHLRQAEKLEALGQLSGGIAHDFNNMLGGIMGYNDLIKHFCAKDNPLIKKYTDTIQTTAKQAADLIKKMLAFSRKVPFEVKEVNIHKIVEAVLGILAHSIDKRVTLTKRLNAENPYVMGDESQLQNIFLNMGINARDAMPNGGELVFETEEVSIDDKYLRTHAGELAPGTYLAISVSDTGIGMDEVTKRKIFNPFFTTKQIGKGTGMGLASAYGTVKEHKGSIEVYSELGQGTVFRIYLPLASDADRKSVPLVTAFTRGSGTILLIEDEITIREAGTKMLTEMGYAVHAYPDGPAALEFFKDQYQQIDLVITDVTLPKMSGNQIIDELKRIDDKTKILITSGYSLHTEPIRPIKENAVDFLQKPFDMVQLSNKVHTALSK